MFTIKKADTPADFEVIIGLAAQIWHPTYGHILSAEQLAYMYARTYTPLELQRQVADGQTFYILFADGVPKGYAAWSWLDATARLPKLNKIYVLPTEQGTGIGRFLLTAIENIVQAEGASALQLCVNRYNNAQHFYTRLGYTLLYEADFPFGPYFMNDYVLQKTFL